MFKTQREYQPQGCLRAKHIYNLARLLYQISPEGAINGIRSGNRSWSARVACHWIRDIFLFLNHAKFNIVKM